MDGVLESVHRERVGSSGKARISVFGLGYVGAVSVACFAQQGHVVVGVDINTDKVGCMNAGQATIFEPGLDDLLAEGLASGRVSATSSATTALADTDISMI